MEKYGVNKKSLKDVIAAQEEKKRIEIDKQKEQQYINNKQQKAKENKR